MFLKLTNFSSGSLTISVDKSIPIIIGSIAATYSKNAFIITTVASITGTPLALYFEILAKLTRARQCSIQNNTENPIDTWILFCIVQFKCQYCTILRIQ